MKAVASVLVTAVFAAMVAAIAGCGAASTVDPVAQAATTSTAASGYRMKLEIAVTSPELPTPITGTGFGSFDARSHTGRVSLLISLGQLANDPLVRQALGGSTVHVDELIDHAILYIKPGALASKLPAGRPWLKLDFSKVGKAVGMPGLPSLLNNPVGNDPTQVLEYMRAASGRVSSLGKANVDGIATTHYRATIDFDKVASRVPPSQRPAVQQTINALKARTGLRYVPVDVWIDGNHLMRRMRFAFGEDLPIGGPMRFTLRSDITSYGPQQPRSLPPASQVTDLTALSRHLAIGS